MPKSIRIEKKEAWKRLDWVLEHGRNWIEDLPDNWTEEDEQARRQGLTLAEIAYCLEISERSLRHWQKTGRLARGTGRRGYITPGDVVAAVCPDVEE
jgi:hypothetical protein